MSQEFSVLPFVKAFQHILAFLNAFQNDCKWFLKYIDARYEHFISQLQCQKHLNMNKIKQDQLAQIMNI